MGDIVELTTWQKHKNVFYEITGNCINFDVKSSGGAAVGLTNKPGPQCFIWVIIGDGDRTCIKEFDNNFVAIINTNVLEQHVYNTFWISWANNVVTLGKSGSKTPLLHSNTKLQDLKYVTFSAIENGPPVHWKIEFPPMLKKTPLRAISNGKLRWVECDTTLPNDAVIGGFDLEFLYIIRAKHRGSLTPGAFVPSEGCGYISWGGQCHDKTTFEVLCGFDYMWVRTIRDNIPINAMEAGYSEMHREPLYVGRAFYKGKVIPGKVQPSHNVCYIPFGDQEKAVESYEILVIPDKNIQNIKKSRMSEFNINIICNSPIVYAPSGDENAEDEFDYPNEFM